MAPLGRGSLAVEVAATHAGGFEAYDDNGNRLGSFRPIEGIAGAGYGLPLSGVIRLGCSLHALYLGAQGDHMTGFSATVGLESGIPGGSIGLSLRNIGPDPSGDQGTYRLPGEVAVGFSRFLGGRGLLSMTGTIDRDRSLGLNGGARWTASSALSLLAGFAYRPGDEGSAVRPGAGIEIVVGSLGVGYSFAPASDGPATHHIALRFVKTTAEPRLVARGTEPVPSTWAVWGGIHRTEAGATAEVHALEMQDVRGAVIVANDDGTFRVRIAGHLEEKAARELAKLLRADALPE